MTREEFEAELRRYSKFALGEQYLSTTLIAIGFAICSRLDGIINRTDNAEFKKPDEG